MTIPAECWDFPGFKNCHLEAGHETHRFCEDLYAPTSPEFKNCYEKVLAEKTELDCVRTLGCGASSMSASSATTASMKTLPWAVYSPITKGIQEDANQVLPGMGLPKVGTDGKLGPATCAGIKAIIDKGRISGWVLPTACTAPPKPITAPLPEQVVFTQPTEAEIQAAQAPVQASTGTKLAVIAGGVLLAMGGYYYWSTRK